MKTYLFLIALSWLPLSQAEAQSLKPQPDAPEHVTCFFRNGEPELNIPLVGDDGKVAPFQKKIPGGQVEVRSEDIVKGAVARIRISYQRADDKQIEVVMENPSRKELAFSKIVTGCSVGTTAQLLEPVINAASFRGRAPVSNGKNNLSGKLNGPNEGDESQARRARIATYEEVLLQALDGAQEKGTATGNGKSLRGRMQPQQPTNSGPQHGIK